MRATQAIEHRESFMSVPFKLSLTFDKAQSHPILSRVFSENQDLFKQDKKNNATQLTLMVNMIYERLLGDESFWKTYLDMLPDVKLLCFWPLDILSQAQDASLMSDVQSESAELEEEWL